MLLGKDRLVLGLFNDWVWMWMGHVLQQVWLHGRSPFRMVKAEMGIFVDFTEVSKVYRSCRGDQETGLRFLRRGCANLLI